MYITIIYHEGKRMTTNSLTENGSRPRDAVTKAVSEEKRAVVHTVSGEIVASIIMYGCYEGAGRSRD
jgi:hypothetical protein